MLPSKMKEPKMLKDRTLTATLETTVASWTPLFKIIITTIIIMMMMTGACLTNTRALRTKQECRNTSCLIENARKF